MRSKSNNDAVNNFKFNGFSDVYNQKLINTGNSGDSKNSFGLSYQDKLSSNALVLRQQLAQ